MTDPATQLMGEERILPEQWHAQAIEHSPELRLLGAILEDACAMLVRRIDCQATRDARAWFDNPELGRISLRYVCEHLGLDVSYIRRGAERALARQVRIPRRTHTANGRSRISVNERIRIKREVGS